MSQGTHSPDTAWLVLEPDMCMYKIDAAARLELVQARMPGEKFADYESFAESIEDPKSKATFLESLEKWRVPRSVAGIQHAPWPQAATSEPSPPTCCLRGEGLRYQSELLRNSSLFWTRLTRRPARVRR